MNKILSLFLFLLISASCSTSKKHTSGTMSSDESERIPSSLSKEDELTQVFMSSFRVYHTDQKDFVGEVLSVDRMSRMVEIREESSGSIGLHNPANLLVDHGCMRGGTLCVDDIIYENGRWGRIEAVNRFEDLQNPHPNAVGVRFTKNGSPGAFKHYSVGAAMKMKTDAAAQRK